MKKMIGRGGGKPYKIRLNKQADNDILSHMYSEDGVTDSWNESG